MSLSPPFFRSLSELWGHLSGRRRKQFYFLLIYILFTSVSEVAGIGAVIPFLGVLTDPASVFDNKLLKPLLTWYGVQSPADILFPVTIGFVIVAAVAGATRLGLLWFSTKLSYATGAEIGMNIYRRTLFQPYKVHISRNSSEVVTGIITKANSIAGGILNPILSIITTAVILISITATITMINPTIALAAFGIFGSLYLMIALASRRKLAKNGEIAAREQTQIVKSLQEGLGGIRDIILDGSQNTYCEIYRKSDFPLREVTISNIFTGSSPRYILEAAGMIIMAGFAYTLSQKPGGVMAVIPFLGTLAIGAQRILPVLQQGFQSWANIRISQPALHDVLEFLRQPLPEHAFLPNPSPLSFTDKISVRDLSFQYNPNGPAVLQKISFDIPKGSRIGFIGATGSGKSTLLDILMGLLEPSHGEITVDGESIHGRSLRRWQMNIAHVPQAIFLSDSTIAENIAFGIPKDQIDMERVKKAAEQAQLSEHIDSLREKYGTFVGERGIRLSGGQRQRIGIARALYKQTDVIVFDEATSALDNETEKAVISTIESMGRNLTILMIAHRLSTLQNCDKVIELQNGRFIRETTPESGKKIPANNV